MLFTCGVDPFEELLSVDAVTTTRGEWRPLAMVRQTLTVFLNTQIISTVVTKEAYAIAVITTFSHLSMETLGIMGNSKFKLTLQVRLRELLTQQKLKLLGSTRNKSGLIAKRIQTSKTKGKSLWSNR